MEVSRAVQQIDCSSWDEFKSGLRHEYAEQMDGHRAAGQPWRAMEGEGQQVAGDGLAVVAGVGAAEDRHGEEVPAEVEAGRSQMSPVRRTV